MQEGYQAATRVPYSTVEQCKAALDLCLEMARHADPNMISDVGTGALMARAGAHAAAYNVRINLPSIKDEAFRNEMIGGLQSLVDECDRIADEVAAKVNEALEY
jgi:glutamate formiminotransferase/formiminotetrahydrofolate cyclodeaminase